MQVASTDQIEKKSEVMGGS